MPVTRENAVTISPYISVFINPQMSFVSDNSHPKQDELPMNDGFKNGDTNIDFTQLKLDDKGKDENVLFV